jgi:hypothetical protein
LTSFDGREIIASGGSNRNDLDRFKEFIEKRQSETGGWRGQVQQGTVTER